VFPNNINQFAGVENRIFGCVNLAFFGHVCTTYTFAFVRLFGSTAIELCAPRLLSRRTHVSARVSRGPSTPGLEVSRPEAVFSLA
jgi:hypothetical protein